MKGLGFGIDRGGTFTDVFVVYPDGVNRTFKLLSEDKNNYEDAPTEAIRRILSEFTGQKINREEKIPTGKFFSFFIFKKIVFQKILNGFEWVPLWPPMPCWSEKERKLLF